MAAKSKKISIVIPIYKDTLNHNEVMVIKNLLELYGAKKLCIACPKSIKLSSEVTTDIKKEEFNDSYFKSIESYNKLMLSEEFYERFSDFKFILIHQLDAYLFKDELDFWCDQDYDYIGAPWLRDERFLVKIFRSKKVKKRGPIFNKVGNGGLSLRKIDTFLKFTRKHRQLIENYKSHSLYGIEDVFWSIIAPKFEKFSIPNYEIAAKFSLDRKPALGMKLNNNKLPFGCHGFEKDKTKKFWKKFIKEIK
ncbi:MAG: DUF5672 family protein [Psychroflexus sp.]